ncbi:MAG: plastocyanin/azurin family copper-binding protein [Anaerolineae bacterium]
MRHLRSLITGRLGTKIAIAGALAFVLGLGVAAGTPTKAQEAPTVYVMQVGAQGPGNSDLLQYAPGVLQVHRGDVVTWAIGGFHNVHVGGAEPKPLVVVADVNGAQTPIINPEVAFPYGAKSGESYTGVESNSGIIMEGAPIYSLTIDVEPGTTFSVQCDIHPGMAGSVTVVEDSVAIPSPTEVTLMAGAEIGASANAILPVYYENFANSAANMASVDGKANVMVGYDVGRAAGLLYFPYVTTIKAGESVTWTILDTNIEPHTVSNPPIYGQDIAPIEQPNAPPILAVGASLAPMTESGATVKAGEPFSSGLFLPGQSFTLTFADAGVYPYSCNIHPGMNGVVIVQ